MGEKIIEDWRDKYKEVIKAFLRFLKNSDNRYILKGGNALSICYGFDRLPEAID